MKNKSYNGHGACRFEEKARTDSLSLLMDFKSVIRNQVVGLHLIGRRWTTMHDKQSALPIFFVFDTIQSIPVHLQGCYCYVFFVVIFIHHVTIL